MGSGSVKAKAEAQYLQEEIQRLESEYQAQNRQEKKHCRLAKARRKLDSAQKRKQRAWIKSTHTGQQMGFAHLEELFDFLRRRTSVSKSKNAGKTDASQP